jgi:3-oxoacyl-[acyl-carrier protein] reductase
MATTKFFGIEGMKNLLILTGGSQGIGKATIEQFIESGWDAINLSRNPCTVSGVTHISVDFLSPDWKTACLSSLEAACKTAKKVSLVHNAAHYLSDSIQTIEENHLQQSMMLNAMIPAILTSHLIPVLPQGSSIIYIGSTLSEKAVKNNCSYSMSKHAIVGLMRATCQDLESMGIHTCCVCPGITDTAMLRARCQHQESTLDFLKNLSSEKRLIEPREIADLIYFCANHSVINGSVLHAHLGQIEH